MSAASCDLFSDPRTPEVLRRLQTPGGYEAFEAQVVGARFCRRPVRLRGSVTRTGPDGSREELFDSAKLPDGVLLKACGTRRETVCPPCASIYRGDAFALVAAGLRGGKGVPESARSHPAVMVTLTAPSFGPVHRRSSDGACHPFGKRCPHGRALFCAKRHAHDDEVLGQALCPACYDYESAVLFNTSVSELWRRTVIYSLRALGNLAGLSVRSVSKQVRLSYVKVVEFQERGSVHVHGVIRLDGIGERLVAPPGAFSAELLAAALELAARRVSAPRPGSDDGSRLRWGEQIEVAVITDQDDGRRRAAAYLGKYATKGITANGVLDHPLRAGIPESLELRTHLRRLVETAFQLALDPVHKELRLRAWAHNGGYRGHFLTKSRGFSTTFAELRAVRRNWRIAQKDETVIIDGDSDASAEEASSSWCFVGMGYTTVGDAWLAECIGEEERMARRHLYEERMERDGDF